MKGVLLSGCGENCQALVIREESMAAHQVTKPIWIYSLSMLMPSLPSPYFQISIQASHLTWSLRQIFPQRRVGPGSCWTCWCGRAAWWCCSGRLAPPRCDHSPDAQRGSRRRRRVPQAGHVHSGSAHRTCTRKREWSCITKQIEEISFISKWEKSCSKVY